MSVLGLSLTIPVNGEQLFAVADGAPDVVGELFLTTSVHEDTLSDLARAYDQGYLEMKIANPTIDPWIPGEGAEIVVPSLYVIPAAPRDGVVVNVPEMRMYVFERKKTAQNLTVRTYPISIGRQNWTTPKGRMKIVAKAENPAWYPPQSIRDEHAAEGDILPRVVPPGPENPLGAHALRLSEAGYLIHGTNRPYGIGMRVTHGCIRMYPKDVAILFDRVPVGAAVHVVNQPYKVGIAHGNIYLEVHPHLDEDDVLFADQYSHVVKLILDRVKDYDVELVWEQIKTTVSSRDGIPQVVGNYRARTSVSTSPTNSVLNRS